MQQEDTIIALATPPGSSALALLRLSGPLSHVIVSELAGRSLNSGPAHYVKLRHEQEILDDVILTLWSRPRSFTGEDVAEISCHGNMLIVQTLIQAATQRGARPARPGEFSQRAFLNGKMDLTQAESVIDLIHARSERALRAARAMQEGLLGQQLETARETLLQMLSHLEAYIDFPEEDISPDVGQNFITQMEATRQLLSRLLLGAREGRLLREGVSVALIGQPNAGKSSLMNALLERDRSIVSARPGTTRDTVEEVLMLEGIQVRLIDTAGLREAEDEVEQLGLARTSRAMATADLLLWVSDGSRVEEALDPALFPPGTPVLRCYNKADLPLAQARTKDALAVSSVTGQGLAELRQALIKTLQLNQQAASLDAVAINARHQSLLTQADLALSEALELQHRAAAPELVSSHLRQALHALGELIGQVSNEDILDRLFQNFCLGK
ncbi:MAG: tRNA uridine-5-carboxymethylaminomethyl(34) synthesis GTPase MnmE [Blastochloris sp.]|nr:tRNA uridine-5-carboxymethylaminomethyl(34) synthesis GTPase MnmE [Blastochloris sp.]